MSFERGMSICTPTTMVDVRPKSNGHQGASSIYGTGLLLPIETVSGFAGSITSTPLVIETVDRRASAEDDQFRLTPYASGELF